MMEQFPQKESIPAITNPEEAKQYIEDLFERGERPVVTVPEEYIEAIQRGLEPHTGWIPDLSIIAGTLGRDPYLPEKERRIQVQITDINKSQIHPRFTGPDRAFHGVITIDGPIPPEALHILH